MRALVAGVALALTACSAAHDREPPAAEAAQPLICDDTLDAVPYECADGRFFSVRSSTDASCAVIFAGDLTYVLRPVAVAEGHLETDGAVSLRSSETGERATLSGVPGGDYADCRAVEE
ncbi:MAG: hypothetical protein R3C25_14140 [Hyphomonadaceae bacterium]